MKGGLCKKGLVSIPPQCALFPYVQQWLCFFADNKRLRSCTIPFSNGFQLNKPRIFFQCVTANFHGLGFCFRCNYLLASQLFDMGISNDVRQSEQVPLCLNLRLVYHRCGIIWSCEKREEKSG